MTCEKKDSSHGVIVCGTTSTISNGSSSSVAAPEAARATR